MLSLGSLIAGSAAFFMRRPRVLMAMAGLAALAVAIFAFRGCVYQEAMNDVREQNDQAVSDADLAAMGRELCAEKRREGADVMWDFARSKCVRAIAPDRMPVDD